MKIKTPTKRGRPDKFWDIEKITQTQQMLPFLNNTATVPYSAYEALIHENGIRVAEWILRAKACGANINVDVKALLAYLERATEWQQRTQRIAQEPDRNVTKVTAFLQSERKATQDVDSSQAPDSLVLPHRPSDGGHQS